MPIPRSPRRFLLLYLFVAVYSLLHIFTWAMSRYRLPVDAVLLLFAALSITEIVAPRRQGYFAGRSMTGFPPDSEFFRAGRGWQTHHLPRGHQALGSPGPAF
ncbi:MAG: hypothetical protein HZY76_19795 [Anaerolineae bacterium]|nr:MAG: hypothetical protein HZY76_19795 [Anaerolineae bacterium]